MTLREAAERTSRSITTLRRYIHSGRLHAEKRYGRFGPEYFVSERDLSDAGLDPDPADSARSLAPRPAAAPVAAAETLNNRFLREIVPLSLFQELQMKHEQLLVQYGMVRAGGLRVMELRAELEAGQAQLQQAEAAAGRLRRDHAQELARLEQQLREARFELEGRRLEIDALQEKVRALEMLARNAATSETIDNQLRRLSEQTRQVERLKARANLLEGPDDPTPEH